MNWRRTLLIAGGIAFTLGGLHLADRYGIFTSKPERTAIAPAGENSLALSKQYDNTPHGVTEISVYSWPVYSNGWGVTEFTDYSIHVEKHAGIWWDESRQNLFPIPAGKLNPAWERENNYNPNISGFTAN